VPRPKSLLPNVVVDEAKKAHNCQHNAAHRLEQGDRRLRLGVQRTHEHFCVQCGLDIIERDIAKLRALAHQLRGGR
jgi:ribosomal protein L18